jgi:hypothetical protein
MKIVGPLAACFFYSNCSVVDFFFSNELMWRKTSIDCPGDRDAECFFGQNEEDFEGRRVLFLSDRGVEIIRFLRTRLTM